MTIHDIISWPGVFSPEGLALLESVHDVRTAHTARQEAEHIIASTPSSWWLDYLGDEHQGQAVDARVFDNGKMCGLSIRLDSDDSVVWAMARLDAQAIVHHIHAICEQMLGSE